jgi:DNA-binding LytR/AlgR family response regulator
VSEAPTALIADDEPLLLAELRDLLAEAWPELRIVAEASNGADALRMIDEKKPDVAFLDIEMPRIDGVDVAAATKDVRVVFVTAYERYAVDAFDRGATDYLLKPLTPARLAIAVQRLKALLRPAEGNGLRFVQAWSGNTMRVVPIDEVVAFLSQDKYTRVVTARGDLLLRRSLTDLRGELDGDFWTINRGTVIHARYIEQIERGDGRELHVRMQALPKPILVGRQYRDRFRGM